MTLDQFKPGMRVYIIIQHVPEEHLEGTAGNMWDGSDPPPIIVRFDNGVTVRVEEEHAHLFHPVPLN